jgi:hypothetical protein
MSDQGPTIRKQMYELTSEDFEYSPVWEFCLDEEGTEGQDECTVRPCNLTDLPPHSWGSYLIASTVTFGDGSRSSGYMFADETNLVSASPTVFIGEKSTPLGIGSMQTEEAAAEGKQKYYTFIGKDRASVFPMHFKSEIPIAGVCLEYTLDGFFIMGGPRNGEFVR